MSNLKAAVIVVGLLAAGVSVLGGYDVWRGFHMGTTAAVFPDDGRALLVRTVDVPFLRDRTYELWWVSLQDGRVTHTAREQASFGRELRYVGAPGGRLWFLSPWRALSHRSAHDLADRVDATPLLKAHPTLGPRFDYAGFVAGRGPIVVDQRGARYALARDGSMLELDVYATSQARRHNIDWRDDYLPFTRSHVAPRSPSLQAVPLVRAGFPYDDDDRAILPREGGGFLVVGERLQEGGDQTTKHVVLRVDDAGAQRWRVDLLDAAGDTPVDPLGRFHVGARLRGLRAVPGRVWAVVEVYADSNRATRLVEIDAASGAVLRAIAPQPP